MHRPARHIPHIREAAAAAPGATPPLTPPLPINPVIPLGVQSVEIGQSLELRGISAPGATLGLSGRLVPVALAEGPLSVTVAAGILQKAGLITYQRGHVNIVDRPRLETASCECYEMMQQQNRKWRGEAD